MESLKPPVTYQGAKQRIAADLIDNIAWDPNTRFFDLCCGSGAVSLELIGRDFEPNQITMVDAGPWGLFWEAVGRGVFSLSEMRYYCKQIPKDRYKIKPFMENLSRQLVDHDAPYIFVLLQAASFGGKAIWIEGGRWRNCSFRSFWHPTATSKRRSTVNPMMPMPDTLLSRLEELVPCMRGVDGRCCRVETITPSPNDVAYIDPPYGDTTGYGHTLPNVEQLARNMPCLTYVSESRSLHGTSHAILIAGNRSKGGISGTRKKANEEWLSVYYPLREAA